MRFNILYTAAAALVILGTAVSGLYKAYKSVAVADWAFSLYQAKTTTEYYAVFGTEFEKDPELTCALVEELWEGVEAREYAYCFTPIQQQVLRSRTGRIGLSIGKEAGNFIVHTVFQDTPAQRAGLKAGDIIVEIDGKSLDRQARDLGKKHGITTTDIVIAISGKPGTEVTLKVARFGEGILEFTLVREDLNLDTVHYSIITLPNGKKAGYIKLRKFGIEQENEPTTEDLKDALSSLREADIDAVIVDIMDNPGGYDSVAADAVSHFIERGTVLTERCRVPCFPNKLGIKSRERTLQAKPGGLALDLPIIVLTNKGSASASEIFAGAIQDYKRGLVIGMPTAGKGVGQLRFKLKNGVELTIPTFTWHTPSGRNIHGEGIQPDILAPEHEVLTKAKECLERYFEGEIKDLIECR